MKIKLSKSQWELVGRKAGWMKTASLKKIAYLQNISDIPEGDIKECIRYYGFNPKDPLVNEIYHKINDLLTKKMIKEDEAFEEHIRKSPPDFENFSTAMTNEISEEEIMAGLPKGQKVLALSILAYLCAKAYISKDDASGKRIYILN